MVKDVSRKRPKAVRCRSRAKVFIMQNDTATATGKTQRTYLFVGISQLVFQDCFAVGQVLHLVGQGVEGLDQLLDQPSGFHADLSHSAGPLCHDGRMRGVVVVHRQDGRGTCAKGDVGKKEGKKEEVNKRMQFFIEAGTPYSL